MKQHKQTIKGFFSGFLTAALILALAVPAMAAIQEIKVSMGGINIYVDGQLKIPVNAQGARVDPMVYDGTTYLPVRAIANMLGKEVTWDGDTSSIYIGEKPAQGAKAVPAEELDKYNGVLSVQTGDRAKYTLLGDDHAPFNAIKGTDSLVWKLASDYQSLDGKFIIAYSVLGSDGKYQVSFYNVDQYGEKSLIKEYTNKCGDGIIDFHVNVTACDFVQIEIKQVGKSSSGTPVLYDITATTAD